MLWTTLSVALAVGPDVTLVWKGGRTQLAVLPPPGQDISPDAPADVRLRHEVSGSVDGAAESMEITVATFGSAVLQGLPVGSLRGRTVEGTVDVQLCDKASGICAPSSVAVQATVPDVRKGALTMATRAAAVGPAAPAFGRDTTGDADRAFAEAASRGELVLLDFSAVWCPPCNLLAAEVLHAPDHEALLAGFQLAVLDVDHRSSWTLKDRYHVGGYPTVIVADPDGTERARLVGYDDRASFLAFLESSKRAPIADPTGLSADQAAEEGWRRIQAGQDEGLEPWVTASAGSDALSAHLLRFRTSPSDAEARWLIDHAPSAALKWVPYASAWRTSDTGRPLAREALQASLARASGAGSADLLALSGALAPEDQQPLLAAAAASALKSAFTGDDARDRAHWTYYASLLDEAGATDDAIAFLDAKTAAYPDEPTFLLTAAGILNRHERFAEALERTTLALTRSWGDNRLRVAAKHCAALVGLGRDAEARGFADKTLHAEGPPADGLDVRTGRYRAELEAFLE